MISLPRQPRRADTQSRHADADTQTRASNEARNDGPLRQRARELRHRVLGAVHAVVLDSTARPRLLDLQLPRRRQTSCPALLALVALCCLRGLGNRTEGTQAEFMTEFMDPVRVS